MPCCTCSDGPRNYDIDICRDCAPDWTGDCILAAIGTQPALYFEPWGATSFTNLCGQAKAGYRCPTVTDLRWHVDDECDVVKFTLTAYASASDSTPTVFTATVDRDWYLTSATVGPYTLTVCTDPSPALPTTRICCLEINFPWSPPELKTFAYGCNEWVNLLVTPLSDLLDLCAESTSQIGNSEWCGGLAMCGRTGPVREWYQLRWFINPSLTTVTMVLENVTTGAAAILASGSFPVAGWWTSPQTLTLTPAGVARWPSAGGSLTVTACGTTPIDPPPCDSGSGDCFPDCISAMGPPDCTTPQHVLLFVDVTGVAGCCLAGFDFEYDVGQSAYYFSFADTECYPGGPAYELKMYCDGGAIKLRIKLRSVDGTISDTTSTITLTCVGGDVSYSFDVPTSTFFSFLDYCNTGSGTLTFTIFSNN